MKTPKHFNRIAVAIIATSFLTGCQSVSVTASIGDIDNGNIRQQEVSQRLDIAPPSQPANLKANTNATEMDKKIASARELERQDRVEEALQAFEQLVARHGESSVSNQRMAVLNRKLGNEVAADRYFAKAFKLLPTDPELLCDIGYHHFLKKDLASAELHFKTALQISPNFQRAHNNLGALLASRNKDADALARFRAAGADAATARRNLNVAKAEFAAHSNPETEVARRLPPIVAAPSGIGQNIKNKTFPLAEPVANARVIPMTKPGNTLPTKSKPRLLVPLTDVKVLQPVAPDNLETQNDIVQVSAISLPRVEEEADVTQVEQFIEEEAPVMNLPSAVSTRRWQRWSR